MLRRDKSCPVLTNRLAAIRWLTSALLLLRCPVPLNLRARPGARRCGLALLAASLLASACTGARPSGLGDSGSARIGLFTTLPIFWAESQDLRGLLRNDAPPHWVLTALRRQGEVQPLDSLMPASGTARRLAGLRLLVMAQPRALAPQENVALDRWVRGGGHLLMFADPMLTEDSAFAIGDRRRPQAVVLLSPILARWGLRLKFNDEQAAGEHLVDLLSTSLPVNLPGQLERAGGSQHCALLTNGVAASCRVGRGRVLVVADAALLERDRGDDASGNRDLLDRLITAVMGQG